MSSAEFALKGTLPFRLGTTSYILPDDIIPNVRFLAPLVDDIELVLFESSDQSNLPDAAAIGELAAIGSAHNLTYTVHFPIDRKAGDPDARVRQAFTDQARAIIELTRPLNPVGYLLHLEGIDAQADHKTQAAWRDRVDPVCASLVRTGIDPALLCVENLGYPPDWHREIVEGHRLSDCLDIGHLVRLGSPWQEQAHRIAPSLRIVHLHGVSQGRDHVALHAAMDYDAALCTGYLIEHFRGVVTIEVFDRESLFTSLEFIETLWRQSH